MDGRCGGGKELCWRSYEEWCNVHEIGEEIDAGKKQTDIDCDLEGIKDDEKYIHLDNKGLKELNFPTSGNWFRKLQLMDIKELEQQICRLDEIQHKVIDVGLKFVKGLKKMSNTQKPENVVVIGGAGSGKSTVIECLAQWCQVSKIFTQIWWWSKLPLYS